MRKGAEVDIFALLNFVREEVTELSLVFILVIKTFHTVVGPAAFVLLRTFLRVREFAELGSVVVVVTTLVLYRMEVIATFVVVGGILFRTLEAFEVFEVEMLELEGLASAMMEFVQVDEDLVF